uniref:PH domain-containing protein n=1 Tax=Heterorhabditis bacteriophora TaxID=37862 RepID=A0A1I7XDR2_HETBA
MPDNEFTLGANGHFRASPEKMNGEENSVLKDWNPRKLVEVLYEVSYEPRVETKRNRFVNMEGHVDVPSDETNTLAELERNWKQLYMRTKEGRLQIYVSHYADEAPAEEIVLSSTDIDANREERSLTIHGGREHIKMVIRVPSAVFDKWRQALLSHAASSQIDAYVKPIPKSFQHLTERVVVLELGSCSIRGGVLTTEPSLPQSFFPSIAVKTDDGRIVVGADAYAPEVRHNGEFVRPIQATDPALERYSMDRKVVQACMQKVVNDLAIDPRKYKVLLSISQNIPTALIGELLSTTLSDIQFQGVAITRQPSLVLYAYDVTTGVVVDIGDRLNIVPVIDGYVVESAICSIPYGATQVREALRTTLCSNNKGLYSFQSPVEKLILRYVMEQTSYVPEDYSEEEQKNNNEVHISLDSFEPTPAMPTKFNCICSKDNTAQIDSSRFLCTEGLFRPKKWGLDTKGLHQLIHEAVQISPIDSRRTLYRNIYLAGGASLLPGLAEKLEQELATIVPNTIHTQVHISPWRYNAAYLGAQIVASSSTFEDSCVNQENLPRFLNQLHSSSF